MINHHYEERKQRGRIDHGDKFDASQMDAVMAADPVGIGAYFGTTVRVRVRTTYQDGAHFDRTGRLSTTMGWRPGILLMHRSSDTGSWDVLRPGDRITHVQRGREYRELGR